MGGHSSITVNRTDIAYGDWVRYQGKDYVFFEMTDDSDIILRDLDYDWEFIRISRLDFQFGDAVFICKADDPRFFIGNHI